ncbi:MAG: transketolase [Deltaproteobacteria bacterium RIFOXYD12_FULL_53_23]|nr:MAG: transketolase [Deltaproteobacteria bacterium RIFOXYD12_FULL_53_23]
MRNALCDTLISLYKQNRFLFMTGDLGFMALEPLRAIMGGDFVNAGVAEQNMVSAAAGVAHTGLQTWVYSIAPFAYARPFEQIRNDVCLHDLDVKIVGNGGGYAYGYMGATHHAIEDYGVMAALQNMICHIPAFAGDVLPIARRMQQTPGPAYLRLGRHEMPVEAVLPDYAPWRELLSGESGNIVVVGPVVGQVYQAVQSVMAKKGGSFGLWVLTELPVPEIPQGLRESIVQHPEKPLIIVEEHVAHGGVGMAICHLLAKLGASPRNFRHLHAAGYLKGSGYGTQQFHRKQSGIDAESVELLLGGLV